MRRLYTGHPRGPAAAQFPQNGGVHPTTTLTMPAENKRSIALISETFSMTLKEGSRQKDYINVKIRKRSEYLLDLQIL